MNLSRHLVLLFAALAFLANADVTNPALVGLSPEQAHTTAISLATKGKTAEALEYFRLAATQAPLNAAFQNNLGVTLLRLQKFEEAAQQFELALEINPTMADAIDNVKDLFQFWPEMTLGVHSAKVLNLPVRLPATMKSVNQNDGKDKNESTHIDEDKDDKVTPVDLSYDDEEDDGLSETQNTSNSNESSFEFVTKNKNTRWRLPRFTSAELSLEKNTVYASGKLPFVLSMGIPQQGVKKASTQQVFHLSTNAVDDTHVSETLLADLISEFPSSTVDFYPTNMREITNRPLLAPMSTALPDLASTIPSLSHVLTQKTEKYLAAPGAYIQWNVTPGEWKKLISKVRIPKAPKTPFFSDNAWISSCLSDPALEKEFTLKTHWRMMLIGTRGAGMFNHADTLRTASFQLQLLGAKRWHLCAPTQRAYLYGAGTVDAFDPDYIKYPLFSRARCWEDVVEAGELVFYPRDYWHQTRNEADLSIAISGSVVDSFSYQEIRETLLNDVCLLDKFRWSFSSSLCAQLNSSHCLPAWDEIHSN